ncbi:MAG: Hpt domain-containing protein [Pseudomonadota bacterium]
MSSNLAEINFNQGLRHCDGEKELYRAVLVCYLDQFRPLLDARVLLEDVEAARLQFHTLKSLSATIGATPLSKMAAQLFIKWQEKNDDERAEAIIQVNTNLALVNGQIESYCNELNSAD